jgi:hypothetical protein
MDKVGIGTQVRMLVQEIAVPAFLIFKVASSAWSKVSTASEEAY